MSKPVVVGLTGGSGSGKTHILYELKKRLGETNVAVLSQDNYYRPISEQKRDENGIENFDLPESIDRVAFLEDVQQLIAGHAIERSEYTFNNEAGCASSIKTESKPVLIIEGIFVLFHPEINDLLDVKIFVDCDRQKMVERRINRDARERGYDRSDVLYRFDHHVWPTYETYILPQRDAADFVIDNSADDYKVDWTALISKLNLDTCH